MKKIFSLVAIAATSLMLGSCGLGSVGSSVGSSLLSNAASSALTSTTGSSSASSLASTGLSLLSNLLGSSSDVSTSSIVGTWTYSQPQVTFESSNVLSKLGGEVVGNKIESALSTQLTKIGMKQGVSTFTFDDSGNVTVTMNGKTTKGTYTLSDNKLTMTGALGLTKGSCTVTINNNELYMLFDASTLLNVASKLGSKSTTLTSLLGNYNGMKLGWSCTK